MRGNCRKDCVEGTNPQGVVGRDGYTMVAWRLSFEDDVAADLMDFHIVPALAEVRDEYLSAQVAREFHATATTSSRVRCKRMEAGGAESK